MTHDRVSCNRPILHDADLNRIRMPMTTTLPLVFEQIKQDLLSRIGEQWPEGTRIPPASELARELGTGQRNTQRAMQALVREGYLRSRPGRGTFVAPQLPAAARRRSPAPQRRARTDTQVLILLQFNGQDGFLMEIGHAIQAAAQARDLDARFEFFINKLDLREPPYNRYEALAILNPDNRTIHLNDNQKVVVVSTINSVQVSSIGGFDVVSIEEEHGAFLAGRHLRDAGHTRACFLGVRHKSTPTVTEPTSALRLRGFEAGFGAAVAPEDQLWATAYNDQSGAVALTRYLALPDRPRAVFAASDELAIGFAIGALAMGLRPGADFDLIGFDGQHRGRQLGECPPLTSVAIPSRDMGRRAAEMLLDRIEHPDKPVERALLTCSIQAGGTVGSSISHPVAETSL
jgi:DNA-binding LacI/PurR family transcriptional regulator